MPYTQIGPNGWPQTRRLNEDQLTSEGYTRATQLFPDSIDNSSLENLRPPNLPDRPERPAAYVAFQSFGRASPPSDASQSSSLTVTPVAASPTMAPPTLPVAPPSSGYISVDEANKFRAQSDFVSDPRAYSRVAMAPQPQRPQNQPQRPQNRPQNFQSNSSMISSDVAALSAKDLNSPTVASNGGQSRHTFV